MCSFEVARINCYGGEAVSRTIVEVQGRKLVNTKAPVMEEVKRKMLNNGS